MDLDGGRAGGRSGVRGGPADGGPSIFACDAAAVGDFQCAYTITKQPFRYGELRRHRRLRPLRRQRHAAPAAPIAKTGGALATAALTRSNN